MSWNRAISNGSGRWVSWHLRRGWDAVRPFDLAALSVMGLWAGLVFVVNSPLRQEVEALRRTPSATSAAGGALPIAAAASSPDAESVDRVAAFMRFLPQIESRDLQLRGFHALARDSGARIATIDYAPSDLEHLPGGRLTLRVSAVADRPGYRKLVHDLLANFPNLAIDLLATQMDAAQPARLEIRIESSLYYRHASLIERNTP